MSSFPERCLSAIAFKKKIFEQTLLSRLGQFGREATKREPFFRCMGTLEERLLDPRGQRLNRREGVQMGVLLFALLPELLNRVVIRRIGWQLEDLKPCRLPGEAGFALGAGVIRRAILNQHDGWRGVRQHPREKGRVGGGVEAAVVPLIQEAPGEVLNQPEDFIALARA
jgi:hypothetical protein